MHQQSLKNAAAHCIFPLCGPQTQALTSVLCSTVLPRHLQPVLKPAAKAPATPCYVDGTHTNKHTHISACITSLNIFNKTEIIQNLFFDQDGNDIENQVQRDVSRNSKIFALYALTLK